MAFGKSKHARKMDGGGPQGESHIWCTLFTCVGVRAAPTIVVLHASEKGPSLLPLDLNLDRNKETELSERPRNSWTDDAQFQVLFRHGHERVLGLDPAPLTNTARRDVPRTRWCTTAARGVRLHNAIRGGFAAFARRRRHDAGGGTSISRPRSTKRARFLTPAHHRERSPQARLLRLHRSHWPSARRAWRPSRGPATRDGMGWSP